MTWLDRLFKKENKYKDPYSLQDIAVDMHSHLLPGIDDGSKSMDETIALLAKFQSLGYRKVITTPHTMSEVYPNTPEKINTLWAEVKHASEQLGLTIDIEAASEYYFDETFADSISNKEVLHFGENFVLLEFSFHTPPSNETQLFFDMQTAGYKPVLAHFERYAYFHGSLEMAEKYRELGVNIQLNLLSLTGHYGNAIRKQAERLIDAGLVDFVGTDCHRIQHLLILEENLHLPYFHKLKQIPLKNRAL